jgi:hypothetical protein
MDGWAGVLVAGWVTGWVAGLLHFKLNAPPTRDH